MVRVCGNRTLQVVIMSLTSGSRRQWVDTMLDFLPLNTTVVEAVDGRDKQSVADALQRDRVPFHRLCPTRGEWGMLALFATRHRAFASQTSDFQLTLEDDLALKANLSRYVQNIIGAHWCAGPPVPRQRCTIGGKPQKCYDPRTPPDIVQLGSYGKHL